MRVENFLSSRIVTTTREFDAKIEQPTFYDAIPLGKTSAVMIADGMVLSNTNVISVSSKIYSASKVSFASHRLYRCFLSHWMNVGRHSFFSHLFFSCYYGEPFFLFLEDLRCMEAYEVGYSSQVSQILASSWANLFLSSRSPHIFFSLLDTDSLVISNCRSLLATEKIELQTISNRESPTLFCDTTIAHNLARSYFKTMHHLLDFNSIDEQVNLWHMIRVHDWQMIRPFFILFNPSHTL